MMEKTISSDFDFMM